MNVKPIGKAEFIKAITRVEQAPPPRPTVVFAGRSNVGKSSLLNRLVNRKNLARTSSTPGRTQEIIYFDIEDRYYFVDLPGYGYAKAPKQVQRRWGPMIERFLGNADGIRLVVLILDARRTPTDQDHQLIGWLEHRALPYLFAVTKCDKLSKAQLSKRLAAIQADLGLESDEALLPVSAQKGTGIESLRAVIRDVLNPSEE